MGVSAEGMHFQQASPFDFKRYSVVNNAPVWGFIVEISQWGGRKEGCIGVLCNSQLIAH